MTTSTRHTAESLLTAAEALFSERGYAAVGIREIADRAGANVAAIKYHYGSKRELYLATVRAVMSRRAPDCAWSRLPDDDPADAEDAARRLAAFTLGYVSTLMTPGAEQPCAALMMWEAVRPSDAIDDVVEAYVRPGHAALQRVIRALLPADERTLAPEYTLSHLGQIMHYRVFRPFIERLEDHEWRGDGDAQRVADHITRVSLRAMGHPESRITRVLRETKAETKGETKKECVT